jgi:hypothetical protein
MTRESAATKKTAWRRFIKINSYRLCAGQVGVISPGRTGIGELHPHHQALSHGGKRMSRRKITNSYFIGKIPRKFKSIFAKLALNAQHASIAEFFSSFFQAHSSGNQIPLRNLRPRDIR